MHELPFPLFRGLALPRYTAASLLFLLMTLALNGCASLTPTNVRVGNGPVQITVPADVRIESIDQKKVNSPNLYQGQYVVQLNEGEHRLVFRYEANWNTQDDSGHMVRWPAREFVAELNAAGNYRIQHPPVRNREQAEQLAASAPLHLLMNGEKLAGETVIAAELAYFRPLQPGLQAPATLDTMTRLWDALSADDQARFRHWLQQQP
ncbi:DUF2057 family protein [Thalassolituus sp. LLYu03]|uniref:DUF2057 family protein n=1 Tax=Thalassolituus sp. LLYu03 TaxID=3421656 RepID=UPI003D2BA06A